MPKVRLNFKGDDVYTEKEGRIHKLTPEVETKIDAIPGVVDNLTSPSRTDALSAYQGMLLQAEIDNLSSVGRFLSTWDCTTGLPTTDPLLNPYTYNTGDYYIVSAIADTSQGGINYMPFGSTYIAGIASTAVETLTVAMNDWYLYDGSGWVLQHSSGAVIAIDPELSPTSTNAIQNAAVTQALGTKQDNISDLSTIRSNAALGATALQPGQVSNISELINDSGYATTGEVTSAVGGAISNASYSSSWDNVNTIAPSKNAVYDIIETKQDKIIPGTNITVGADGKTISATDTKYNAATSSTLGLAKLGSDTVQTVAINNPSSTNNRTYPIQMNGSNQLVVNVPWTDNNTTYSTATSTTAGTVKLGSDVRQNDTVQGPTTDQGRTYPIQINNTDQMVVNIPWTDTNTTYSAGTNVSIDANNKISATDTTYPTLTAANIKTGTATTPSVVTASNLASSLVRISSNTNGSKTQIWTGTKAQYNAVSPKDANTLYFVTD